MRDKKVSKTSLVEHAYKQLEEMLVTLEFPPNMFLSEEELSRRLNIGRTPVREAVKRLEVDGLIKVLPRRGLVVTEVDVEQELLLLEVRRELERLVARRAAVHSTKEEKRRLVELADAMEEAAQSGDQITYVRLDKEFNDLVVNAARNPVAKRAIAPLHTAHRRFWFIHYQYRTENLPRGAARHAALMRAIATGDSGAAAMASDELMDLIEDLTSAVMPPRFSEWVEKNQT